MTILNAIFFVANLICAMNTNVFWVIRVFNTIVAGLCFYATLKGVKYGR